MAMSFTEQEINEGIITDSGIREKLADHIEVLDRAGKLLTMPKVNMATTEQVAEFFMVPVDTVNSCFLRNKNEIEDDGVKVWDSKSLECSGCTFQKGGRGFRICVMEDGSPVRINNRGIRLFPKRAVLRIAMLLTGSEVAKAIRTALLNLTEKVEEKALQLVDEMVQEQGEVMKAVAMAFTSGDIQKTTEAFLKITSWQAGKINEARAAITELKTANLELTQANESLGTVNQMLIGEYAPLDPKSTVIRIMLAVNKAKGFQGIGRTYNEFYRELRYHEHIDVMKRRADGVTGKAMKKPEALIRFIRDYEWTNVFRCLVWFCCRYAVDPWAETNDATVEKYHLDSATYDGKTYVPTHMKVYRQEADANGIA